MQFGVHLPHIGRKATPDLIRRAALQAEALGFDDVWVSEHIIVPADAPYPPSPAFYEPVLTLTWAAACTRKIRLGTSVLVLPMRHPLPLAKELATLQNLSEGRLILGAGVGWMEAEFAALGARFHERGKRMDEGLALMRAVWTEDPVTFPTTHIEAQVEAMRMQPLPCAPIPVWIGGASAPALARAARHDGWHGSRVAPDQAAALVAQLRALRPGPEFTLSLRVRWDGANEAGMHAAFAAYADAGIDHLLVEPQERDAAAWLDAVERIAAARA